MVNRIVLGGDDGPGLQELQGWREGDVSEACQQAQGSYRGVDIQAGGEGYGGEDCEEFGERDLEDVEHQAVCSRSRRA